MRSEGHVSVRSVYCPRMQALTTRRKSLAFQHSDIPGKDLQLTQRPQRHSSPHHTRRPTASPRSSPAPRPELLRRHASPPQPGPAQQIAGKLSQVIHVARRRMVVVERGLGESRGVPKRHTEDAVRAFVAHQEHNEGTGNDRAREETQPVSTNSSGT